MSIHTTNPAGRRLHGKSVIVTGAARGQGASHAERLAAEGARVLACDVLDAEGKATADRLQEAGLEVDYLHLDVTSPGDWAQAVQHARTATGRLDVLVNNAGIIHVTPLLEEQAKDWDAMFAVNATGPLLGIQAAGVGGLALSTYFAERQEPETRIDVVRHRWLDQMADTERMVSALEVAARHQRLSAPDRPTVTASA